MTQELPFEDPVLPPNVDMASSSMSPSDTRHPDIASLPPGNPVHAPEAVQTLKRAMRRARLDDAERVGVQADLRATQIGRLELLQEALEPLLSQIPKNADLFDVGLMPGATPRLFIDMIGFVEMGRDARVYRFLQDTRHGRLTLSETAVISTMVEAITDYVARRLLERDKALAADEFGTGLAAPAPGVAGKTEIAANVAPRPDPKLPREPERQSHSRRILGWAGAVFAFVIDLLGAIAFFTILAVAGWLLWYRLHGQV